MARTVRILSAVTAAIVIAVCLAPPAPAAASKYVDKKLGFSIRLPRDWTQTPTQPGETTEVAKFKDDRKRDFSTLSILRFGKGGEVTPAEKGEEEPPRAPRGPWSLPDNAHDYLDAIVSRTYKRLGLEVKGLPEPKVLKAGPVEASCYTFDLEHPKMRGYGFAAVAGILTRAGEEYLILFNCPINRLKKSERLFLASIRTFRFPGDDTPDGEDDGEDVEKRGHALVDADELLDPEKREKIKKDLIGTWRFVDTRHYIVIYNCDDGLARFIADRIEWMRVNAYEKVFPPPEPIRDAMVVRVCKEMDEYRHYGGPGGSAGYWASYRDELVFPDLAAGKKPDDETLGVLHHEGFHQYINYALLRHDPPVWFNEGFAEYFFCARPAGKRVTFEKRHPMRYSTVKSALGTGDLIPVKDFIHLTHMEYMQRAQLCYSEGWAFATWLKNVTRDERYQQIPEIFFREMQKGFLDAKDSPFGGMGERSGMVEKALEKAFEGIDLDRMNEDFQKDLKHRM